MTDAQIVRKLKKLYAAEDFFPGVLGNPVVFAARWGLPLSAEYLRSLKPPSSARRKARVSGRKKAGGPRKVKVPGKLTE
jgi:hypothetical protein